jgi:membrane-associated protein
VRTLAAIGPEWLDPEFLITTFGFIGVLAIVFAESGLLVGFFLPGDSLLFTTGLLLSSDGPVRIDLPLGWAILAIVVAAIAGDQVGYAIGSKAGPAIFNRPDSRLFKQEYVDKAYSFFDRYGGRTIVLARFVPIVRTFAPVVAGVGKMRYRTFVSYNVIGGVLWGAGVTTLGYFLGQIEFVRQNIEYILIGIVLLSVIPIVVELMRARSRRRDSRYDEPQERRRVEEEDINPGARG